MAPQNYMTESLTRYNEAMFFRRPEPKGVTFEERLGTLRASGFTVESENDSIARVSRGNCAAEIKDVPGGLPDILKSGVLLRSEIATLVDGGFQKFLRTESGGVAPALATDLKELHDFQEDLRAALGIESLYNESLGTTCDAHNYDRLSGRV